MRRHQDAADYGSIQRFARACGATKAELNELHRLWALADALRHAQSAPDGHETAQAVDRAGEPGEPVTASAWRRPRLRLALVLGAVTLVLLAAGTVWLVQSTGSPPPPTVNGSLLLSPACPPVVSMGQHDECAREVQALLSKIGAKVGVDGDFGPQTLRGVTAFQILAGLQPRGVVDEPTKHALYEQRVSMATWSAERVEKRIREVFPEEPARAVGIARCQSFLDPLYVLPNTNGTRNWGVFQLSDTLLNQFGGTPRQALDPEWNIQAARRAWDRHNDFRDWPNCDQAFRTNSAAPLTTR